MSVTENHNAALAQPRDLDEIRGQSLALVEGSAVAMVGSNGPDGYPRIKAMLKMESEGLTTVWFSTNTSSARVSQFRNDPRASVYFVDATEYKGLLLVGDMAVLTDPASQERVWRPGFEKYGLAGPHDPDHTVFRFTAKCGNYYHGMRNVTFDV